MKLNFNPSKTTCNVFYLKAQFVSHDEHRLGYDNQSVNAVRAKVAVNSHTRTKKHTNASCGINAEFLNVTPYSRECNR